MIINAIIMSIVTYVGMVVIFKKLPTKVKAVLLKCDLVLDIGAACLTYMLLGGSATGIIGAGLVGILVSATLKMHKSQAFETYRMN